MTFGGERWSAERGLPNPCLRVNVGAAPSAATSLPYFPIYKHPNDKYILRVIL